MPVLTVENMKTHVVWSEKLSVYRLNLLLEGQVVDNCMNYYLSHVGDTNPDIKEEDEEAENTEQAN